MPRIATIRDQEKGQTMSTFKQLRDIAMENIPVKLQYDACNSWWVIPTFCLSYNIMNAIPENISCSQSMTKEELYCDCTCKQYLKLKKVKIGQCQTTLIVY